MTASSDNTDPFAQWWRTSIIDMAPGRIAFRGHPIEGLIGNVGFGQMIWLMVVGQLPTPEQASLLEAALVAGVDHGPQAPSIAAARMSATCGVGLNNVIATGVNMLGDVHGGAGEQCAELYFDIASRCPTETPTLAQIAEATRASLAQWREEHGKIIPGFGHRFHKPEDPRAPRLMQLIREAASQGVVSGTYADIAETVQAQIGAGRGEAIALNIDGATAAIFCELGFASPLARGLFCLSRSVGILAHGWEQMQQGGRNKGPMPRSVLPAYEGEPTQQR